MAVYLLHFEQPIAPGRHTARHYLGYASDLAARIQQHERGGRGAARLCQVARERHIPFDVVRVWPRGGRDLEARLKRQHNGKRLCPVCNARVRGRYGEELPVSAISDALLPF